MKRYVVIAYVFISMASYAQPQKIYEDPKTLKWEVISCSSPSGAKFKAKKRCVAWKNLQGNVVEWRCEQNYIACNNSARKK